MSLHPCRLVVAAVALCGAAWSGLPARGGQFFHIERVSPRVGQRGTTVEVTIQGGSLAKPEEVIFYRPGIRAVGIEELPKIAPSILHHGGVIEEQVKCRFEIAPDCPLGEHPFRIRTATDLTTLGTFHVSPFPCIDEGEIAPKDHVNDTRETALAVQPNVTIRGRIGTGPKGDVDFYRVPVKAGERLSVEVDSVRIGERHYGDSEFDLAIRILDETGRVIAANDDNTLHLQDPLVSLKMPRDGMAFVEVRRSSFDGGKEEPYCVHIGRFRRPLAAFPAGGPAGTTLPIRLIGDPLGDTEEAIAVPREPGTFEYYGDAPSPLLLRASSYPNLLEDPAAEATTIGQVPVAVNGILDTPGDSDAFRLSVKKFNPSNGQGDRLRVRVFAATFGAPLDPKLEIRAIDPTGKPGDVELEADDTQFHKDRDIFGTYFRAGGGLKETLDPSIIWEPKADGDYLLSVQDSNGRGGAAGVYRIEIEPANQSSPQSVYFCFWPGGDWVESAKQSSLAIPQGNRWTVNLFQNFGHGCNWPQPFELVARGLPAGVTMIAPPMKPVNATAWPVQFVADATAVPRAALITLEAKPVDPSKTPVTAHAQQNIPYINHPGGDALRTVRLDRFVLAVTAPAPFTIDIAPPAALVRGGELAIPVKITRQQGFDEPVEFSVGYAPPGVGTPPIDTIAAGHNEATVRISAEANAPVGVGQLVVIANTTSGPVRETGVGRRRVSSQIVPLTIAEPFVELASQPESIRRGERKRYLWTVQQKTPFEGQATATLLGLPKGVNVIEPLPTVTKDTKEIVFTIEATDDALLGAVSGLGCELMVKAAGQEIRQRAGKGTLRIDPRL
jgi:hypothetical protein